MSAAPEQRDSGLPDWTDRPVTALVSSLTPVPPDIRDAILWGPADRDTHAKHFDSLPVLREIESGGPVSRRSGIDGSARVVFWNVERLRHLDDVAVSLEALMPDIMLLCEIDRGMARTTNGDRVGQLAARLGTGYIYAVEWIELGLGDIHEKRRHAGEVNAGGLHGAAVLTDAAMARPMLFRIDRRGDWFDGTRTEPRVGGTIAICCTITVADVPVLFVNVHLESHDDPATRAADMRRLLDMIEAVAPGDPVLLGGDFNTSTASHAERHADAEGWRTKLRADPMRLLRPSAHEPLFSLAREYGYDVSACNVPDAPTTRYPAGSHRPPAKIDWFFARGLRASDARIIPALRADGTPSSDHEGLLVTVSPGR